MTFYFQNNFHTSSFDFIVHVKQWKYDDSYLHENPSM